MRVLLMSLGLALGVGLAGCSGPEPEVATAYKAQFGAVKTASFGKCPEIAGVWHLGNLSGGSLTQSDGELVPNFRWFLPYLFGLSVTTQSYIAVEPRSLETVIYLSSRIPGPGASSSSAAYSMLSAQQMPCLGHGWRQVATRDHSTNDAAARVLNLVPEDAPKIIQTDYVARTEAGELLVGIRVDYSGTDRKDKAKKVSDGYWLFLKMPRLFEDAKAQGFRS